MKDGFIKAAACTPEIRVADTEYNAGRIIEMAKTASGMGVKLCVFPELCITGYTCQDLFFQDTLTEGAMKACVRIAKETAECRMLIAVGLPVKAGGKLYNCAAVIYKGEIELFIPKTYLPNYNEFYEMRHFAPYKGKDELKELTRYYSDGKRRWANMGQGLITFADLPELKIGIEICEDLWTADPVSNRLAKAGANIICNLSASNEVIGKESYRRQLVSNQSARLVAGYVYCSAGDGESTQDLVFSGHNIIAENGSVLAESKLFENGVTVSEIDIKKLAFERRKLSTYPAETPYYEENEKNGGYNIPTYQFNRSLGTEDTKLTRYISRTPFIPENKADRSERCELILKMQSHGLMKRIGHTNSKSVVLGISGGLDSTLALLVCVMAMDCLKRPHTDIVAVTMPCFGTTKRTRSNAEILCRALGVTFREVDITKSVLQHFSDINHDESNHNVVFENGQARERTKVLMNIANQAGGLVVGTGDLSELALGWATYNGDHMSMYGVNSSVPKTLVRHIVRYYADTCGSSGRSDSSDETDNTLSGVLYDILDTPVSPELLPTNESGDETTQKTEDLVGPYELHDFFLYYGIRWGFEPKKVYRLAKYAFGGDYDEKTILKWLGVFYRRFFSQQFKRSCLPDSAKIGSVTLSPRGDLRMPSDACADLWIKQIEELMQ